MALLAPFMGGPEGHMGRNLSSGQSFQQDKRLAIKWEKVRGACLHWFMGNGQWFGQMVRDMAVQDQRVRDRGLGKGYLENAHSVRNWCPM